MKKIRENIFGISIIVALITSVTIAAANQAIVVSGIKLPVRQGEVIGASNKEKLYYTNQYYENIGTVSGFLGKYESIIAKPVATSGDCYGLNSKNEWITIGDKDKKGWDGAKTCTAFPGKYSIYLKRAVFNAFTTASHTGDWYYNL